MTPPTSTQVVPRTSSPLKAPVTEITDLPPDDGISPIPVETKSNKLGLGDEDEWSMYEEVLLAQEDDVHGSVEGSESEGAVPAPEALIYRKRLHEIGADAFLAETVEADRISAKTLCTAFGIRTPLFLRGQPDDAYNSLLGLGIARELAKRQRLSQYSTIDDVVSLLQKSKKVILVTGAGISTSLGIPDFRSPTTGLYAQLESLGLSDPQEVFDISLFREDPSIFYSIAKEILPTTNTFSPTHAFIRLLQDKDKVLTNYTQNIDNLEEYAGISPEKLIQCHGSFATAACLDCGFKVPGETIYEDIKACRIPQCQMCIARLQREKELVLQKGKSSALSKRKRHSKGSRASSKRPKKSRRPEWEDSSSASESNEPSKGDASTAAGVMKPAITFFGEALPSLFHDRLIEHDRTQVDLVIVIGTSLKVAPVSEIPGFLPKDVPQIYISRESCKHIDFDVELLGECDVIVQELCRRAGWGSLDAAKGAKGELGGKRVEQKYDVTIAPKPGGDAWQWQIGHTL